MLRDLTIIIPSRNRHSFLLRQIDYWKFQDVKLIILDQSNNSLHIDNSNLGDNIDYYHFTNKNLYERICFASDILVTKYAIYLPDDEFLLPKTLLSCINFLEKNIDYFSCAGRSIEFYIQNKVVARNIYENLENFDLDNDDSFERVMNLSHPYKFQPIHSVSRSKVWKDISKILKKSEKLPPDMFELLFGFTAAYNGKLKVISELMNLRSNENPPVNTIDWNQKFLTPKWLYSLNHKLETKSFFNSLDEINQPDFKNSIIMGVNFYCLNFLMNQNNYYINSKRIINQIKTFIKKTKNKIFPIKYNSLVYHCKSNLIEKGITVDIDRIYLINKILLKFHKIK